MEVGENLYSADKHKPLACIGKFLEKATLVHFMELVAVSFHYSILFYSILGCVLPLQDVALRPSPPSFSVLCCPCPHRSLLPHNVSSPTRKHSSRIGGSKVLSAFI